MEELQVGNSSLLAILHEMSHRVFQAFQSAKGFNRKCLEMDLVRIIGKVPESPEEILKEISYSGMFFKETFEKKEDFARGLVEGFGGRFVAGDIESIVKAFKETFESCTGFKVENDEAVRSLHSRVSMVLSYISGQLLTMAFGKKGFLIVLGSTCLEENLCGTHIKYGLSSGDINPIGCISERDLRSYLKTYSHIPGVSNLLNEPTHPLINENQLTLTLSEVEYLSHLRKIKKLGPFQTFLSCYNLWGDALKTSEKVKLFFITYSKNRHKSTVLTPLLQFDASGCDDNRYDLRQFLYNQSWTSQFLEIDSFLLSLNN
jgi:NAD+ synthase (glutamine-hydrolysing)